MKKISAIILLLLLFITFPICHTHADMGPKSSIEIEILGVTAPYMIDLLFIDELPSQDQIDEIKTWYLDDYDLFSGHEIPDFLWNFSYDGYISSSLYYGRPLMVQELEQNISRYPYSPPQVIRVMIIFDDSHYIVSESINTKLFTSKITWDLSNIDLSVTAIDVGQIKEIFPVGTMTIDLLLRIFGTVAVELLILFAFFYRHLKSYKLAFIVNLTTQTILTGFMFGMHYFWLPLFGELFVLIVGEFFIIIFEIIIYRKYLKEHSKSRAIVYALIANIASIIAGLLIMVYSFVG